MFSRYPTYTYSVHMKNILKGHHISFQHAWEGFIWAVSTQPNFRVHFILSICTLVFASIIRVSRLEFIVLVFTIVLGLSGEMVNTALESVTDLVTKEWRQEAKVAKDVAAGMMLLIAFGATCVALLVFLPYIARAFGW